MDNTVLDILQARILEWVAVPFSKGIFSTQGLNLSLLHFRLILYHLSHVGSPAYIIGHLFVCVHERGWGNNKQD